MSKSATKTESSKMKLDRLSKAYIIDAIDSEPYDVITNTTQEKLWFLWETFNDEYSYMIQRVGPCNAMREWIMGLPSGFNVAFENYRILEIAVEWNSLPKDYTDKQAEKILDNWFNLIANKTMQLFRKYKIN